MNDGSKMGRTYLFMGRSFRLRAYLPVCSLEKFMETAKGGIADLDRAVGCPLLTKEIQVVCTQGGVCLEYYWKPKGIGATSTWEDSDDWAQQLEQAGFNQSKR